jgi:hypothetical protein
VAQDQRQLRPGQLAIGDVQVGAANAAGVYTQPDLARSGHGVRDERRLERAADRGEPHGSHQRGIPSGSLHQRFNLSG